MSLSSVTSRTFSSTTSLQSLPLGHQILRLAGMEALEALQALEVRETKPKPRWPRSVWRNCNPSVPRTPSFQLLGAPDISSPLMSSILQLYMLYSSIFKASMWLCMILQWLMLVSDWHVYGETTFWTLHISWFSRNLQWPLNIVLAFSQQIWGWLRLRISRNRGGRVRLETGYSWPGWLRKALGCAFAEAFPEDLASSKMALHHEARGCRELCQVVSHWQDDCLLWRRGR